MRACWIDLKNIIIVFSVSLSVCVSQKIISCIYHNILYLNFRLIQNELTGELIGKIKYPMMWKNG